MGRFAALLAFAAALAVAPATQAAQATQETRAARAADKVWAKEAKAARTALGRSAAAGYVTAAEQTRYLGILARARAVSERVPRARADLLRTVLAVTARPKSPTTERALVLYTQLEQNAAFLARHEVPSGRMDLADDDGVVYRFFPGTGFAFHPLANATKLNALVTEKRTSEAAALARALAARATPQPDGTSIWEYQLDFGTAKAPWSSGMANAVMALALARAGDRALAARAYRAIPRHLVRELPAGPWVKLYSSSSELVLNAQLQAAVSIGNYAKATGDTEASGYSEQLLETARVMLPRFDTGHWSRYSLGAESTLEYHDYVIDLLKTIRRTHDDPEWTEALERFEAFKSEPPLMLSPSVTPVVYPRPEDGVRDELVVSFRLSKPAKVALVVDGKAVDGYTWRGGRHTFRWPATGLGPGEHRLRLVAQSTDGNPGETDLGTFVVERDREGPTLAASKADGRVFWRAKDVESACCRLRLELRRPGERRVVPLARTKGSAAIPQGYWSVTVSARDAAGNLTQTALGLVIGRAGGDSAT
jgi:hypothetical protein